MTEIILPSFSEDTPNKIGDGIEVSGKHSLKKSEANSYRIAIADEPIDTKVDGKKVFCVRVDNLADCRLTVGFTPLETCDSTKVAFFGFAETATCGLYLLTGALHYPIDVREIIIDEKITRVAKEIIVILEISDHGAKKEIRFLVDGHESKSTDVSQILKEDLLFPVLCLHWKDQRVTTIPIDQIKTRTPEITDLIYENQQRRFVSSALPQVLEVQRILLQQAAIQMRAEMANMKIEN
jgi:hypothetical protein